MDELSQERLKELFTYEPDTGNFIRNVTVSGGHGYAGDIAGTLDAGYIRIRIDGKKYRAHRLAFLYMLGRWPIGEGEHEDGLTHRNVWINLREASHSNNMKNRKMNDLTTTGRKGVHKRGLKYRAKITVNGNQINLGTFNTAEEASSAYYSASAKYFGEFAREACNE